MEQATRNKLRNVVTQCRKLLEESIAQQLEGQFGIRAGKKDAVRIEDEARMSHLSEEDQQYRRDLLDHLEHIKARSFSPKDSLDQLIREIAFTHLNRLCAYKMMEARDVYVGGQKFREAVSRGIKSNGFLMYLGTEGHEEDERLFQTGNQELAYRHFLDWLGGRLSEEIGVLFNPNDPANRLYPRQTTLDEILDLLNDEELAAIWEQDETIGWVYQYFTPKELRDKARKESQAPRNSYELAFRNQFFTPRYVVEFLTDNTLGRIWYEMRKGDTKLAKEGDPAQCRYMVRRPNEIFLDEGQKPPETPESQDDLSQEELLKQPVHIPHRPKKDPRELKILDPACGSGHFLLYCFDLLLTIYEEAYTDPDLGPALQKDYPNLDDLRRDVPRLILAHNLHGIDIDLRCTQIAALALWLRCQRAYQETGLKKDRPKITRSNLVCAEPMPGEQQMLKEFVSQIEPRLLGQLVEVVFDKMKLAGEAGSLLQIEEDIRDAVAAAKKQWLAGPVIVQRSLFDTDEPKPKQQSFDFSGISDEEFFEQAETRVVEELGRYAEKAQNGMRLQRRLFAHDAMRGFAFVDICRKRFDVVLANPPFGDVPSSVRAELKMNYPVTSNNLYSMFHERASMLCDGGMTGVIISRTFILYREFSKFRKSILLSPQRTLGPFVDLGWEVLDEAQVETAAFVTHENRNAPTHGPFFRLIGSSAKENDLLCMIGAETSCDNVFLVGRNHFSLLDWSPFSYWSRPDLLRQFSAAPRLQPDFSYVGQGASPHAIFFRLFFEVPASQVGTKRWMRLARGGEYSPYYRDNSLVIDWLDDGRLVKEYILKKYPYLNGNYGWKIQDESEYSKFGLTFGKRNERFNVQILHSGHIFSDEGPGIILNNKHDCWFLLGWLNSAPALYFLSLTSGLQKHYTYARPIPVLPTGGKAREHIEANAKTIWEIKRAWDTGAEESTVFVKPHCLEFGGPTFRTSCREAIDQHAADSNVVNDLRLRNSDLCMDSIKADKFESELMREEFAKLPADIGFPRWRGFSRNQQEVDLSSRLISYAVGCGFGRWDVRKAEGASSADDPPSEFDAIPQYSPGMLQEGNGVLAIEAPECYPLRIDWDGIVVDDTDHQDDIVRRVREVLEVIWKDRADAIEKEACEILGVKTLRDYFRKPGKGGFWDDHVKRYSKSRRKAPIYWLLQSSKKNYALWLYCHRLDKDMLFKALLNYVEPKIQREENRLGELRSQKSSVGDSGKGAKALDRDIEKQEDLLTELLDFEEKLRKVAELHLVPDLNDGVVLNIAALHELVPWKIAKKYWNELMDGKYEWSSIGKQLREKGLVK